MLVLLSAPSQQDTPSLSWKAWQPYTHSPTDLDEQRAAELDPDILLRLHVVEVESLFAGHHFAFEALAVPHSKLQLHVNARGCLTPINPVGAKPVIGVSLRKHTAVLVHIDRGAIYHLLHFTPLLPR